MTVSKRCRCEPAALAEIVASSAAAAGVRPEPGGEQPSFNWLMTDEWALTVPRRAADDGCVGANATGFAGGFFVRGEEDAAYVRSKDPMDILAALGVPW